jgi:tetratricopeptide (TPR) repeat protein
MQRIHPISILLLVFLLVACSKPDSSILLEGIKAEEAGKNDEAMTAYEKILNEFPDGESAPEATFRLASLYQGHKSDLLKAATMYESIGQNYPDSKFAHEGLFLAGFIYNNELGNDERAGQAYNKYLKLYPDSSWAENAQFELDNLGKTPDEVLQALRDTITEVEPEVDMMIEHGDVKPGGSPHGGMNPEAKVHGE